MKDQSKRKILIIGIGNDSRQDDGLGWAFVKEIQKDGFYDGDLELRYQLHIEDAETISHYKRVIFVDATKEELDGGYEMAPCSLNGQFAFSTHSLSPEAVLSLTSTTYDCHPEASILKISGFEWELGKEMTDNAKKNLQEAFTYFKHLYQTKEKQLT